MRKRIQAHMPMPFHRPAPTLAVSRSCALTLSTPSRIRPAPAGATGSLRRADRRSTARRVAIACLRPEYGPTPAHVADGTATSYPTLRDPGKLAAAGTRAPRGEPEDARDRRSEGVGDDREWWKRAAGCVWRPRATPGAMADRFVAGYRPVSSPEGCK